MQAKVLITGMDKKITERQQRWRSFYNRQQAAAHRLIIRLKDDRPARPAPNPDKQADRIAWAWRHYQEQLEQLQWLDDDAIPHLDAYTGTEIFAEAFGCPVQRAPDAMPFALPLIRRATEVTRLKVPDLSTPCLSRLFEIADKLRELAGTSAVMRLVDIQSPMDIAALIWEKASFFQALLDEPRAVLELAAKVEQLLTAFLDQWFERYGRNFVAHYPDYYLPKGVSVSVDEIGAVGPDLFAQFFLPELTRLSLRYGAIGIHCCANARQHWDRLKLIPGLALLNLVQPPEVLRLAYQQFAASTAQMHSWIPEGDLANQVRALPAGSRVVLQVAADSKDQARKLVAAFKAIHHCA